jgi:putative oxidoreductase
MKAYLEKQMRGVAGQCIYFIFRVLVAFLFMQYGALKLFGLFGGIDGKGGTVALFSLLGLAGIIEFFGPVALIIGFLTRPVAAVMASEMAVAYFMDHASAGFFPILNKGDLALLFFACFLIIIVHGAGRWSLEKLLLGEELF